jgi:hypothetical protein
MMGVVITKIHSIFFQFEYFLFDEFEVSINVMHKARASVQSIQPKQPAPPPTPKPKPIDN